MAPDKDPLVFCPGSIGNDAAKEIANHFGWTQVSIQRLNDTVATTFAQEIRSAFLSQRSIVGVCAAGIIIRSLAQVVQNKFTEPPVICVSPDGRSVIPLLGGHHGANQIAAKIAKHLKAYLAITTASDALLGCSLDEPPTGWRLENPQDVKATVKAILDGTPTNVNGYHDFLKPILELDCVTSTQTMKESSEVQIHANGTPALCYTKQNIALGVGCVRGCSSESLKGLAEDSLTRANISKAAVAGVFSIDLKSNEAAVHELADYLQVPARFFAAKLLESFTSRLSTPSEVVFRETGTHGVSEAAALAAAGTGGELLMPKQTANGATCAAAMIGNGESDQGVPRGTVMIISLGPGGTDWRTSEAHRMLGEADEIVGYSGYLKLLGSSTIDKPTHEFKLGQETERCRFALEIAAGGKKVALVCSGDAGIYAMASLVYELLDSSSNSPSSLSENARRSKIVCAPGISAMQMASARTGAILGHDFCAISLSDLLTPSEQILGRVKAASEGDFVVSFYNPVSLNRRTLLEEARDILIRHRPPQTPVLIARNLGRKGETLSCVALENLRTDHADMLTTIIVGNSQTHSFRSGDTREGVNGTFIYTPRGYSDRVSSDLDGTKGTNSEVGIRAENQ